MNTTSEHHAAETSVSHAQDKSSAENAAGLEKSNVTLTKAKQIINGARQQEYGSAERSFAGIAKMWNIYRLHCMAGREYVTRVDVAMMMILLKVARTNGKPTEDSLVDIAGYAALASDMIDE
jgi:Domain of unknown function (DUF6378)